LVLNVAVLRDRVFAKNSIGPIHSIAVLPLANLSGDPSQDYYADGMTDELITALVENRSLRVVSRTSAMQYKGVSGRCGRSRRRLESTEFWKVR
jgi:TolB-like protein